MLATFATGETGAERSGSANKKWAALFFSVRLKPVRADFGMFEVGQALSKARRSDTTDAGICAGRR